jgi:cysteine desulfurase/selenocysteine lyase
MNRPTPTRLYLDHAATGWPKPESVYQAMDHYARDNGAAAGRGAYSSGVAADQIVTSCRRRLARLIGATDPRQVAFFSNGTTALNAAIFGLLRSGDQVVTTAIEHNSLLRPLESLRFDANLSLEIVPCDESGRVDPQAILDRVTRQTRLVAVSHASNVTGAVQDIATLGKALRGTATLLLCDAAQTLGYLPIDLPGLGIDLLAAPGHKGACGPLGTGLLAVSPKAIEQLRPTIFGGTGSASESLVMPDAMPSRLEPGNLNVTALAGWDAGLAWLAQDDQVARTGRIRELTHTLRQTAEGLRAVRAIGADRLPILSLTFEGVDVGLVASLLDSEYGIETRSGLHCAPLIHRQLGCSPGGTLRISAGHSTTSDQVLRFGTALREIVTELGIG